MEYPNGIFVSVEGIDGSGKTTQVKKILEYLLDKGYRIKITQEPTREKLGLLLREYLRNEHSDPHVDTLLFAADRLEHYYKEIKPALEKGYIVVTDRYAISSYVYQSSQGVPVEWIQEVNKMSPMPDLGFYLSIDVETALERLSRENRNVIEKFENKKHLEYIKMKYESFLSPTFVEVDGNRDLDIITEELSNRIITEYNRLN